MAKLHDVRRGIPHQAFVRRKARERRLERSVALLRFVPWPPWAAPALLILPFPLLALACLVRFGPAEAVLAPALLAGVLVVTGVWGVAADVLAFRRARRRGAPLEVGAREEPLEGPQLRLVLLVAACTLPVIVVLSLLSGSTVAGAVGSAAGAVLLVSASTGAGLLYSSARNRFVRRLLARRAVSRRTSPRSSARRPRSRAGRSSTPR